jgi:hypothetical protein
VIRRQKYEKVFVTVHNRGTNDISGGVSVSLPTSFTALPGRAQPFHAPAGGDARLAFYVSLPGGLPAGSYPIGINWQPDEPLGGATKGLALQLFQLPQWQVLGPFDGGVGSRFVGDFPTNFVAEYAGSGGRKIHWKTVGDDCVGSDGYVDFEKALGKGNNGQTTFGAATITSIADAPAKFHVGSGDALTIWLNGKQVFDKQVDRSAEPDEDVVDMNLRAGENTVLVKISRGIGPNGLYFRVATGSL